MLTSSGQYSDAGRWRDVGISACLTKPIGAADLHEAICRLLDSGSTSQPWLSPPSSLRAKAATVPTGRSVKVLLVEDNVVNQRVAVGLLARRGHVVTVANDGIEALAAMDTGAFDVVLMDLQMPHMGGFEATAEIRRRELESGGHVRIVAMTAHAMSGDRERCLAAGMDEYVAKPIDPAALYASVERPDVPDRGAHVADVSARAAAPIDHDSLMKRLGGDVQLFAEVTRLFLEDCPVRLAAIGAAVDREDAEQIRATAHALKGAAGNISATKLFEATAALERIGAERRLPAARAAWRRLEAEAAIAMQILREFETEEVTP
jgi:two-component system sensor histidine kinase/response regulator